MLASKIVAPCTNTFFAITTNLNIGKENKFLKSALFLFPAEGRT